MKKNHWPIYLVPAFVWLLSQIFLSQPTFFYSSLSLGALAIALGVKSLAGRDKSRHWPLFLFSPVLMLGSLSLYAALLSNWFSVQLVFLALAVFLFFYLRHLHYYWAYGAPERADKLDNLVSVGGVMTIFSLAVSMYTLPMFLKWPAYLPVVFLGPISFFTIFQFAAIKPAEKRSALLWAGIIALILAELAWGLYLLPLRPSVLGGVLVFSYYFLLTIWRLSLRQELSRRRLKYPLLIFAIFFIILLLTATWL